MAPLLTFPRETFQPDPDRVKAAAELKAKLLSRSHTTEIYGEAPDQFGANDLMPDPDQLDATWGNEDESIYDEMGANVLAYSGLREKRIDVMTSLNVTFLAGMKGDADSEAAREEVEDAYLALYEFPTAQRALYLAAERGFSAGENVFDVQTFGRARGLVCPIAIIDRPRKRFGFDYLQRPYYKPHGISQNPQRVDDYKVSFMRCGSLHTKYGKGYGPRCYPTVWTIHALMKGHLAMVERFGYLPVIVKYPASWPDHRAASEHRKLIRQWKNVLMIPDEGVTGLDISPMKTDAAYAAANATGQSRMSSIALLERWLAHEIQGSQNTTSDGTGSFAKESVVSGDRLWKAPSDAAAIEAMLNRGFVEPIMLVNRPAMERHKWPRCAIDVAFGEDLQLMDQIIDSGVKKGVQIAKATWHETFKIRAAMEGEEVLTAPSSSAPAIIDPNADPSLPAETAAVRFAEPVIRIVRPDGTWRELAPDRLVAIDRGRGKTPLLKRAALLQDGDRIVDDPAKYVAAP